MAPLYSGTRVPVNGLKGITKNSAMTYHWPSLAYASDAKNSHEAETTHRVIEIPAVMDNATWEREGARAR